MLLGLLRPFGGATGGKSLATAGSLVVILSLWINVPVSYNRYETKIAQAFYNVFVFRKPKKNGVFSLTQKRHRSLNELKGF